MSSRKIVVALAAILAVAWTMALAVAPAPALDPAEQAIAALNKGVRNPQDLEAAQRAIDAAAAREPSNNRWQFGKALALSARGENIPARDLMQKVVDREPNNADYQFWYGRAIFEAIDETGMLTKLSWGLKGKGALEKAAALDPNHVNCRWALIQFYLEAPAIAGGSAAKAEENAKALLAMPEGRGQFWGHLGLARIASEKKNWAEVDHQYTLAETSPGEGADPRGAMTTHAIILLQQANDPGKALPIAERLAKDAKPDDMTPVYLVGECRRKLGDCKAAVPQFETVLAKKPDAQNSRFGLAACYEQLGDRAGAATQYEEFARRFPKDPRAADATNAAKKLRKPA